jgi:hypothetical protein
LLVLLTLLVAYTIPTLLQLRRTARAVEELVRGVGPRVESATSNLESVLGKADRVSAKLESGAIGVTSALAGLGAFLANLRPPHYAAGPDGANWPAALSSMLTGLFQAWTVFTSKKPAPNPPETAHQTGGKPHV